MTKEKFSKSFTPLEITGTRKKHQENKFLTGFTLIEMLTAITIFLLVIGATMGIFISAIRSQREILTIQQILDQTGYALEHMSRALRMAKKDLTGECLTTAGQYYNYETNAEKNRIRFINYEDQCQEFFLEGNQLKERKSSDNKASNFQSSSLLISGNFQLNSLLFSLSGHSQSDDLQPKVTIFLDILGGNQERPPEIKIQTTISQRNLDVLR